MGNARYDYEALRAEFVEGPEISVRALAAKHDIPWSGLNAYANKGKDEGRDWRTQREVFQRTLADKQLQTVTSTIATKAAEIKRDALDVIHAAIFKMAQDMQDHWVIDPTDDKHRIFVPGIVITPSELSKLLDRLMVLTGSPSVIQENRNIGVDIPPDLPPELARLLADVAGKRGTATRGVGSAALPGRPQPDPN